MYRIIYKNGPVFNERTLETAQQHVEKYTPLKKGWTGAWVMRGRNFHAYIVQNSKGREIQSVSVIKQKSLNSVKG